MCMPTFNLDSWIFQQRLFSVLHQKKNFYCRLPHSYMIREQTLLNTHGFECTQHMILQFIPFGGESKHLREWANWLHSAFWHARNQKLNENKHRISNIKLLMESTLPFYQCAKFTPTHLHEAACYQVALSKLFTNTQFPTIQQNWNHFSQYVFQSGEFSSFLPLPSLAQMSLCARLLSLNRCERHHF